MNQPVHDGAAHQRVVKNRRPLGEVPVAGDNDGTVFIPGENDLEKVILSFSGKGLKAEVIQDQNAGCAQLAEPSAVASIGPSGMKLVKHLDGVPVQHIRSLQAGTDSHRLSQMRLPPPEGPTRNMLRFCSTRVDWALFIREMLED